MEGSEYREMVLALKCMTRTGPLILFGVSLYVDGTPVDCRRFGGGSMGGNNLSWQCALRCLIGFGTARAWGGVARLPSRPGTGSWGW